MTSDGNPGPPVDEPPADAGWVPQQPPPPPPPMPAPPLARSSTDRRIAGVCGGLGAHFSVPSGYFRLGFVVLAFTGGAGIVLYILAMLLMPEQGAAQATGWTGPGSDRHVARTIVAALLLIVAVSILADNVGVRHGGLVWGIGLVTIGVVLLVQERRHSVATFPSSPATFTPAAYAAGPLGAVGATMPSPGASSWVPARTPRQRSVLGMVTVAAALLAIGVAALLDSTGVISLSVGMGFGIALLVVGAGLVAGAWFGRSRALVVLGVLLVPCALVASLIDVPIDGSTGTVVEVPTTLNDVMPTYHLSAGDLTVDMSAVALTADRSVTASVALGKLVVVVPAGSDVVVTAHDGGGHIVLFGVSDDGLNVNTSAQRTPVTGGAVLHLKVDVGLGEIDVEQGSGTVPGSGQ